MEDAQLPRQSTLLVDLLRGARIVGTGTNGGDGTATPIGTAPETEDIYLPKHQELISHIALDIGGSLAKVVYFTRASSRELPPAALPSPPPSTSTSFSSDLNLPNGHGSEAESSGSATAPMTPNGILGPKNLTSSVRMDELPSTIERRPRPTGSSFRQKVRRKSSTSGLPTGGRLNFIKFETTDLSSCVAFLDTLILSSAAANRVPVDVMKKNVKIMATGGGAHKFYDMLRTELGVEVRREEEMECLVLGLGFVMEVPNEVFWYGDELIQAVSHPPPRASTSVEKEDYFPSQSMDPFPRPSPNPPQYSLAFDPAPGPAEFPCLLVNIGSGVSIIRIDDYGKFERISGTSLGGGTLWGLLSLLTGANSFDEMLELADRGDNGTVDMLVGDIYGQDYEKIGLKSSTIASSFGKVFKKGSTTEGGAEERRKAFRPEDISKSLLYAVSNNIGQIAYMNAEKHNLDRIYFGGCFIRGHAATISTLSYAIRFWSKGTKRALFLRHEGYLGSIGAWLKNLSDGADVAASPGAPVEAPFETSSGEATPPTIAVPEAGTD